MPPPTPPLAESSAEPSATQPQGDAVDKSPERIRRMFAGIAGRYDFLNHLLSLNIDRYWRWRTVQQVPPKREDRILDVCTGTGDLALAYLRAVTSLTQPASSVPIQAEPTQIVATDFCEEMLDIGRHKAQKRGVANKIDFLVADTQNLPLPDNQFQIVCVAFGLRNVTDTDRGLAEMVRVCAPGGQVAVLEFSSPQSQPWKFGYQWYFQQVLPRIGKLFAKKQQDAYQYLPQSVGQFPQGEQLAIRFRAAGLAQVEFHPLTLGIATLYVGTKPN